MRGRGKRIALSVTLAIGVILVISAVVAAVAGSAGKGTTPPAAAPAVTVTETLNPLPGPTVTETVTPTANAQGEATSITADGVYVVGKDIPGGTWHTPGGPQCYEASLSSLNTENIIDNSNFNGPDTVSLTGAKAFEISGGCTWSHEGNGQ